VSAEAITNRGVDSRVCFVTHRHHSQVGFLRDVAGFMRAMPPGVASR
jgi:hypothetical protein